MLNDEKNDFKYYIIKTKEFSEPLVFIYNPYDSEEVSLRKGNYYGAMIYTEDINKFARRDYVRTEGDEGNYKKYFTPLKITSDILVESNLKMIFTTNVELKVEKANQFWLISYLFEECPVSEVTIDGQKLDFFIDNKDETLFIKLPKVYDLNQIINLQIKYEGRFLKKFVGQTVVENSIGWYPKFSYKEKSHFDITASYPKNMKFAFIGNNYETVISGDNEISKWRTEYPIRNASFCLGLYRTDSTLTRYGDFVKMFYNNGKYKDETLEEAKLSIEFYSRLFGRLPLDTLYVSEVMSGGGEAFPGMIHITSYAFQVGSKNTSIGQLVPHEVAHQWWGISCDFESYRDQWLSEGFAEYSSLMYVQAVNKDFKHFMKLLDEYKKEIVNVRKSFISDGKKAGLIGLGYRNNSSQTSEDYGLIIYKKGAWVIHMIRNLLFDFDKMNEDVFMDLLRKTYSIYQHKSLTTDAFCKMLENQLGLEFKWFFDQWVNTNHIPHYNYAYKLDKIEGKYILKFKVKQENVPADFKMIVPISLKNDDKTFYHLRSFVTGSNTIEFEFPPQELEPEDIIFNCYNSVLCTSDEKDWEDLN